MTFNAPVDTPRFRRASIENLFQRLIDTLSVTETEGSMRKAIADLVQEIGYQGFAFLHLQPKRTLAISNYPPEWQRRYIDGNYASTDPIVKSARAQWQPFTWGISNPRLAETRDIRRFYEEANTFGIRSGPPSRSERPFSTCRC